MDLAQLLESEGLDGEEVLSWARKRSAELAADLPEDLNLDGLLADMPSLKVIEGGEGGEPTRASLRPPDSDAQLLGDADAEFAGLESGSFEVEEGAPTEEHGSEFDTGPLPEAGAPSEELEIVESAELVEVDEEELEELEGDELMEFASGEYEMVEDLDEPASRPPAPPAAAAPPPPPASRQSAPAEPEEEEEPDLMDLARSSRPAEPGAPEELDDAGSFDIDLDL
jgi:hypothetical protein